MQTIEKKKRKSKEDGRMINYDWKEKIVTITSKDLIELLRTGKLAGQGYPDEEIKGIEVDD